MVELNKIYNEDCLSTLKRIPDNFIDCVVTSPPYWGLRDYGVDGQIGLEPTLEEYFEKMLRITAEIKRVLKPTGVVFWNHGDKYLTNRKCLAMQNYRFIIRMLDEQDWILRNVIIWHKPNSITTGVKDRFDNSHDVVFMLVKNKFYWFDIDSVRKRLEKGFGSHKNGFSSYLEKNGIIIIQLVKIQVTFGQYPFNRSLKPTLPPFL